MSGTRRRKAPTFDKDEWNKRAQDVVSRLSKKYA
jgi:hypothetical protein